MSVVRKGAGRPAAAARTAKAAQRTPLPPKAGTLPERPKHPVGPKAQRFADIAAANGWTVEARHDNKTNTDYLVCKRGDETLTIHWTNEVFQQWAGYTYGNSRTKRVVNAKSGIRLLERGDREAAMDKPGPVPAQTSGARSAAPAKLHDGQFKFGIRSLDGSKLKVLVTGLTADSAKRLERIFNEDPGCKVEVFSS